METLLDLVLLFFVFSFVGWCIEVTLKYRQYHRFINRGFLAGPWLPIYGSGAVLITAAMQLVSRWDDGYGTTFAVSFFLCGALEYGASWVMEKRFHARWWDYNQKPMNLHGRVWIGNLILFGLGGVLIFKILDPLLLPQFARLRLPVKEVIAGCLTAVFIADFIVSHFVLKLVKESVEHSEADNTEAIGREVRLMLHDRSIFYRRFADAYPEVIYRTERVVQRMERVRAETERLRRLAEQRAEDMGSQLAATLERLGRKPALVVTDSQAFKLVSATVPEDIPLTSFSILMARYKGFLRTSAAGVAAVDRLTQDSVVLMAEGCTHHRQCNDIGTVKIPRWLRAHTGLDLKIETCSGREFPDDLSPYSLVVHCGGCMITEREVQYRMRCAEDQGIPFTNYGITIAQMTGALERSVRLFPEIHELVVGGKEASRG